MFVKRTPEKILKQQFDIDLSNFNYSITSFQEEWGDNGDGFCQIVFNLDEITPNNLDYLKSINAKSLPFVERISPNELAWEYLNAKNGLYLYDVSSDDVRNFKLFIVDTKNKKAVLYYQIE
jgi:hypothetical protein